MGLRDAAWNKIKWKYIKKRLGYINDELKMFRENPRNDDVLSKAPELLNKIIIAEVIDSRGCNSQHRFGDRLYFDGTGNLLTEKCPHRICSYAFNAITPQIFSVNELIHAGVDPN